MPRVYILIPSPHPTGPIKGAVALANSLSRFADISLVSLKPGPGTNAAIDPSVEVLSLETARGVINKCRRYRKLLRGSGERGEVVSISFCLSADLVNLFCRKDAVTISSVRGNLPQNYKFDYGWKGAWVAAVHLFLLRWFDDVVAMTDSMAVQIFRYTGRQPRIVGNFVDEEKLKRHIDRPGKKSGPHRFVFVGSLTERKQAQLLISAAVELKRADLDFRIDIVGDGPMQDKLISRAGENKIDDVVFFHGYISEPYHLISRADCMVLPSISEGVSRAVLESLFFGVPCILRDTDGHNEVIRNGHNGFLFKEDSELAQLMLNAARWSRRHIEEGAMLIPDTYRQETAARQYLAMLNPEAS